MLNTLQVLSCCYLVHEFTTRLLLMLLTPCSTHKSTSMFVLISGSIKALLLVLQGPMQRSKLTFSIIHLLATFNFKMVAIKIQLLKKNPEEEDTSWHVTRRANAPNSTFSTLNFASSSLRIHVEFLNAQRGKEKDR